MNGGKGKEGGGKKKINPFQAHFLSLKFFKIRPRSIELAEIIMTIITIKISIGCFYNGK